MFVLNIEPLKLIETVRAHECIYNTECLNYKKPAWRQQAWEQVGAAMGVKVSDCKLYWNQLRNAFSHSLARRAKAGANAEKFDKWRYEEQISFILPYLKRSKIHLHEKGDNEGINKDKTQSDDQKTATMPPLKIADNSLLERYVKLNDNKMIIRRKRKIQECTGNTEHMIFGVPTTTSTTKAAMEDKDNKEKDDIDLFFESVANTVKKLPKLERIKLKWDIMRMVNEVETRCLESTADIATKDMCTVTSEQIAPSSSSSLLVPEQSLAKCKEEPSDSSTSSQDSINEKDDELIEAQTLTIIGDSKVILESNWPNLSQEVTSTDTFAALTDPNSTSASQRLPYITKVQSLSTVQKDPLEVYIKKEFD